MKRSKNRPPKYMIIGQIVHPMDAAMMFLAHQQDHEMERTLLAIARWLQMHATVVEARAPLCLACEHEFRRGHALPNSYLVMVITERRTGRTSGAVVTGICDRCIGQGDQTLLTHWQKNAAPKLGLDGGEVRITHPTPRSGGLQS